MTTGLFERPKDRAETQLSHREEKEPDAVNRSRLRKREAILRRHFPRPSDRQTVQEEPVPVVSEPLVIEATRSQSTGRITPLRKRTVERLKKANRERFGPTDAPSPSEVAHSNPDTHEDEKVDPEPGRVVRTPTRFSRRREVVKKRMSEKRISTPTRANQALSEEHFKVTPPRVPKDVCADVCASIPPRETSSSGDAAGSTSDEAAAADTMDDASRDIDRSSLPTFSSDVGLYSSTEGKPDTTARAFDFRSVHDAPPFDPTQHETGIDPSWDVNKVYFNEFDNRQGSVDQNDNIFAESDVWVVPESAMFGELDSTERPVNTGQEEKKEKDGIDDVDIQGMDEFMDDNLDPLGWPRPPEELRPVEPEDPFSVEVVVESSGSDNGDANLLGDDHYRSEAGLTDILGVYEVPNLERKTVRLAFYTTIEPDLASLEAQSEEDAEAEDEESTDEDLDRVDYENQLDESGSEEDVVGQDALDDAGTDIAVDVEVPTFEAAFTASLPEGTESDPPVNQVLTCFPFSNACALSNPPEGSAQSPPPTPSYETQGRSAKVKVKKGSRGGLFPLLAPPPGEKLRQWEESKLKSYGAPSSDVEHTVATTPRDVQAEPSMDNADTPCASDFAVILPGELVDNLPASKDRNLSPVSSSAVIRDSKLAEKLDLAISIAASKFEESITDVRPVSSEDLSGGAFSTWTVKSPDQESFDDRRYSIDPPPEEQTSNNDLFPLPTDLDSPRPDHQNLSTLGSRISDMSARRRELGGDVSAVGERKWIVPEIHPSPFEYLMLNSPTELSTILSFLGDPVAVSRMKMVSTDCRQHVDKHEYVLMRDAARFGAMSMNVRPYFWLWLTLQKGGEYGHLRSIGHSRSDHSEAYDLQALERAGREGKWHSVIERDVARAFGNLPPHKMGARLRTDSIVRALVTWGKNRLMKSGVKGAGAAPPRSGSSIESDDESLTPTDTVSDWGGVTPVGSFAGSVSGEGKDDFGDHAPRETRRRRISPDELALSGNTLTEEMKATLQGKLRFILHALAAAHRDVGYCQGMDYVVAHLLRILQDTIRWKATNGTLPPIIKSAPRTFYGQDLDEHERTEMYAEIDRSLVVEEACFRVMDSLFTTYSLQHFYWPELRCLKTSCLVFERLIQIKLPVLADHFEHHELNVGLFALGWFQTLFLYLPSMPTATVCHMWDIWLVERSYKIFFRVGTAILFLSQPILLNHELEGMMSYLNTFPDATLLSPDILIACALQIKVTNKILMELEEEIMNSSQRI